MIGKIIFSWKFSKHLDCEAKTFRFLADILNDCGSICFLLLGIIKYNQDNSRTMVEKSNDTDHYICLFLLCTGSLFKALCSVAAVTKNTLTFHFARSNNISDVSCKDSTQETIINLLSMVFGSFFVTYIDSNYSFNGNMFFFLILLYLHLFFNYKACRSIILDTLNTQRLEIVVFDYIKQREFCRYPKLLTPLQVSKVENIIQWHIDNFLFSFRVVSGVDIQIDETNYLKVTYKGQRKIKSIIFCLLENSDNNDFLKIGYHILCYKYANILFDEQKDINAFAMKYYSYYQDFKLRIEKSGWNHENLMTLYEDKGFRLQPGKME
jgi:hypothetical protein